MTDKIRGSGASYTPGSLFVCYSHTLPFFFSIYVSEKLLELDSIVFDLMNRNMIISKARKVIKQPVIKYVTIHCLHADEQLVAEVWLWAKQEQDVVGRPCPIFICYAPVHRLSGFFIGAMMWLQRAVRKWSWERLSETSTFLMCYDSLPPCDDALWCDKKRGAKRD